MRGTLTDQDLTNYALNDGLNSRERLYVESMLGLNEECRGDVYKLMDLGQMLEEGFEEDALLSAPSLTAEQRAHLVAPQPVRFSAMQFFRYSAATMAAAACLALVLAQPQWWGAKGTHARAMNAVTTEVARVVNVISPSAEHDLAEWMTASYTDDDANDWRQVSTDSMPGAMPTDETICTPPTWQVEAETME